MPNLLNIRVCIKLFSLNWALHSIPLVFCSSNVFYGKSIPTTNPHLCFTFQYQSTRPFFIQVEMPTDSVKGEQLGIRIALFNYWNTALEVCYIPHSFNSPPQKKTHTLTLTKWNTALELRYTPWIPRHPLHPHANTPHPHPWDSLKYNWNTPPKTVSGPENWVRSPFFPVPVQVPVSVQV